MIRRLVALVVSWPKIVIALVVAITIFLGFSITKLRVNLDIEDQIPPGHPLVLASRRAEQLFGGKLITIVGFYPKEGTVYTPEILGKVKRITEAVEKMPGVKPSSVLSLMSPQMKDIRSTEEAIEVQPLAKTVPENEAQMAEFRQRVERNRLMTSLLVSDDGRATSLIFDFDDFEAAGGAKEFYPKLEALLDQERTPNLEIVSAGPTVVTYWLLVYTRRVGALFLLTLAMIGYLLYRAFRTVQGMLIPLVTAILGVVWALGMMGLLGGLIGAQLDPWNIMTPILLLAIGAGHSVQILKRYYEEYRRVTTAQPDIDPKQANREAVIEATTKVGAVMLAAGTIAALSFASLVALGLPSIRNFGLCTGFGIMAALVVELTFIPAMRSLLPAPSASHAARERKKEIFDPILEGMASLVRRRKEGPILWGFLVLIVFAAIGAGMLQTRNSLAAQFFEMNGPMHGFRMADERTAGTRVVQVLVEGSKIDAIKDPEVLARMDALTTYIHDLKLPIGKVVSIVDVLKVMNRVIENKPSAEVLPKSREAAAQYLLLYGMSGDEGDLRRLVDADYQNAVITIYLRTDDHRVIRKLVDEVQAESQRLFAGLPVKVSVGGGVSNMLALNETMVHGKIQNLIQISALVLIITTLALRSIVAGFLVLLPLATSALVNLGLMGWAGIWLTMGTAAISAMAVGIGADYAIYFIFRVREELQRTQDLREATAIALTTSGKAIAYVATAVGGGYLCLTLSLFKTHVLLGLLVALTMVTCSAATLAFLPAVLLRLSPRFLLRKARPAVSTQPAA